METTRLTLAQLLWAHLVAARAVGGEMKNVLFLVRGLLRVVAVLLRGWDYFFAFLVSCVGAEPAYGVRVALHRYVKQ